MKLMIFLFLFLLGTVRCLEGAMLHAKLPISGEWKQENLSPFNELRMSWNTPRPVDGKFLLYFRVKTNEWSPWLFYAAWGSEGQASLPKFPEPTYKHAFEEGKKANAFQVKIVAEGQASLNTIHAIHVYVNGDKDPQASNFVPLSDSIYLPVIGLSQMTLNHPRYKDLCSPTAMTAVCRFLSNNDTINVMSFAQNVWDSSFDVFGNWVFNVAEASTYLGSAWYCWVEKLDGFEDIYQYLVQGIPVIVCVKSPLPGSAKIYEKGHIMAVIGYDSENQKVICMDPAFPKDDETHVSYNLSDFLSAWSRRENLAFVFSKKRNELI